MIESNPVAFVVAFTSIGAATSAVELTSFDGLAGGGLAGALAVTLLFGAGALVNRHDADGSLAGRAVLGIAALGAATGVAVSVAESPYHRAMLGGYLALFLYFGGVVALEPLRGGRA